MGIIGIGLFIISLFIPKIIDTAETTKNDINKIIEDRTVAIKNRDCDKSPTFELAFIKSTPEEKNIWVQSCNKYSKDQRSFEMVTY